MPRGQRGLAGGGEGAPLGGAAPPPLSSREPWGEWGSPQEEVVPGAGGFLPRERGRGLGAHLPAGPA